MNIDDLVECVNTGREIEFKWDNRMYSITYAMINGVHIISFCEFYKESTEVTDIDDLLNIKRNNVTVRDMLKSISDEDIWMY